VTKYPGDLSAWQRGVMDEEQKNLAAISLVGKPAPELDGAQWLNTDHKKLSLAELRDKFVLLQFWTTWCGPCHADMPSVKLVDQLYRDRGVVVIGIHDNSMPFEAIENDVVKQELKYPMVVDHSDGRILESYKAHGISGYPSYVLIGRDGNVIFDDETVAAPGLRTFKIELIRQLLATEKQGKR
jgi:thiol-disulfide isomerase/thioredoxin